MTLVLLVPQHMSAPASPLRDYGSPTAIADYKPQFANARGDVLVLGDIPDVAAHPEAWDETLAGNMFYINDASVQNAYSSVYYPSYQANLCMYYNGSTCAEAYSMLFAENEQTDLPPLADLLGVSTVQSLKAVIPEDAWSAVPDGWQVVEDTPLARTIVRDDPIDGAGGVSWLSPGTGITVLHQDAMGVSFRVDTVPDDGGTAMLSRIPWPGYSATNAAVVDGPLHPLLLAVAIDGETEGDVVTVSYWSPGWQVQVFAGVLIVLLLGAWVLLRRIPRRDDSRIGTWAGGARARAGAA